MNEKVKEFVKFAESLKYQKYQQEQQEQLQQQQEQLQNKVNKNDGNDGNDDEGSKNNKSYLKQIKFEETKRLSSAVARIVSKIAEDLNSEETEGDDVWDCEKIMLRKINHNSIQKCKKSFKKEKIIFALDFSGSCDDYSQFFLNLLVSSLSFKDIEIFDASNGFSATQNKKIVEKEVTNFEYCNFEYCNFEYFFNKTIIFFGDFDGGASLCELSKKANIYWFSCERRYEELDEHSWCRGLYLKKDFHSYKARYYPCFNEKDFINLIKKIKV